MVKIKTQKSPKKTGFGAVSAVIVAFAIYFGSQLIAGFLLGAVLYGLGKTSDEINRLLTHSVTVQFSFIFVVEALSLWFLWLFLKSRQISLKEIGISKPKSNQLLYAVPAYGIYFLILVISYAIIDQFVPKVNLEQTQQIGFEGATGVFPLILVFISLVILPAVVEEVLVRGFLYSGLIKKFKKIVAALIASVIFGAAHLQLGSGEPPLWMAAVDTFILSMILIYLREKTGNIWAGVGVHMLKNTFAFISLFLISVV